MGSLTLGMEVAAVCVSVRVFSHLVNADCSKDGRSGGGDDDDNDYRRRACERLAILIKRNQRSLFSVHLSSTEDNKKSSNLYRFYGWDVLHN